MTGVVGGVNVGQVGFGVLVLVVGLVGLGDGVLEGGSLGVNVGGGV